MDAVIDSTIASSYPSLNVMGSLIYLLLPLTLLLFVALVYGLLKSDGWRNDDATCKPWKCLEEPQKRINERTNERVECRRSLRGSITKRHTEKPVHSATQQLKQQLYDWIIHRYTLCLPFSLLSFFVSRILSHPFLYLFSLLTQHKIPNIKRKKERKRKITDL